MNEALGMVETRGLSEQLRQPMQWRDRECRRGRQGIPSQWVCSGVGPRGCRLRESCDRSGIYRGPPRGEN